MDPDFENFFCLAIDTYCAFLQFYHNFMKQGNQELELRCWGSCLNGSCDIPAVFKHLNYNMLNDAQVRVGSDHVCAKADLKQKKIYGNLFDQNDQSPIKQELDGQIDDQTGSDMASLYIFKCWGGDRYGHSSMPNYQDGQVESFVTGDGYTCVLGQSRGVKCQGRGQTGLKYMHQGTIEDSSSVKRQQNKYNYNHVNHIDEYQDNQFNQISAGGRNTCFIKGTTLSCTGNNWYNQLSIPAAHKHTSTVVESGWDYSCSVNTQHRIQCWGLNILGQTDTRILHKLNKIEEVVSFHSVKTGLNHSCATQKINYQMQNRKSKTVNKTNNKDNLYKLVCWGGHNEFGQLDIPMKFQQNADHMFAVADDNTCALNVQDQSRYSFDQFSRDDVEKGVKEAVASIVDNVVRNVRGVNNTNLNDNDNEIEIESISSDLDSDEYQNNLPIHNPTDFPTTLNEFAHRFVNDIINQVIANLETENTQQPPPPTAPTIMSEITCWGSNEFGQTDSPRAGWFATQYGSFAQRKKQLRALEAGGAHACWVERFLMKCWGSDSQGQSSIPVMIVAMDAIVSVALGAAHTCILVVFAERDELAHNIICQGGMFDGQRKQYRGDGNRMGFGNEQIEGSGEQREAVPRVLSAGFEHNCLIGQSRQAECWGNDEDGDVQDVQNL